MSDLLDFIATLDSEEVDEQIAQAKQQLAILSSIRKVLDRGSVNGNRLKATRPRAEIDASISLEIARRVLGLLQKHSPLDFHGIRAELSCGLTQLSAALARDWFAKDGANWSLSPAGERAVRDGEATKKGIKQ